MRMLDWIEIEDYQFELCMYLLHLLLDLIVIEDFASFLDIEQVNFGVVGLFLIVPDIVPIKIISFEHSIVN